MKNLLLISSILSFIHSFYLLLTYPKSLIFLVSDAFGIILLTEYQNMVANERPQFSIKKMIAG